MRSDPVDERDLILGQVWSANLVQPFVDLLVHELTHRASVFEAGSGRVSPPPAPGTPEFIMLVLAAPLPMMRRALEKARDAEKEAQRSESNG